MTQLSRTAAGALNNLSVYDYAAADSGAEGYRHKRGVTLSAPGSEFAVSRGISVVPERNRLSGQLFKHGGKRNTGKAQIVGINNDPVPDYPRRADSDSGYRFLIRYSRLRADTAAEGVNIAAYFFRAAGNIGLYRGFFHDRKFFVNDPGGNIRSSEVNSDPVFSHRRFLCAGSCSARHFSDYFLRL